MKQKENTTMVVLHPREEFYVWIAIILKKIKDESPATISFNIEELLDDCTVISIPFKKESPEFYDYFQGNLEKVFTMELARITKDKNFYPAEITQDLFYKLFGVELFSHVVELS